MLTLSRTSVLSRAIDKPPRSCFRSSIDSGKMAGDMVDLVQTFITHKEEVKEIRVIFGLYFTNLKKIMMQRRIFLNMICEKYEANWQGKEDLSNELQTVTRSMDQLIHVIDELLGQIDHQISLYEGCMERIEIWKNIDSEVKFLRKKLNMLENMRNQEQNAIDEVKEELSDWESRIGFYSTLRVELSGYLDMWPSNYNQWTDKFTFDESSYQESVRSVYTKWEQMLRTFSECASETGQSQDGEIKKEQDHFNDQFKKKFPFIIPFKREI
ncbi:hypothetical protein NPIL_485981 [Nephila pilipes]|uniref:Uncharacterized protein n=1 Tax=Nephila pilipes TaxID=299642 RepID=A0A8X6U5S8_NEPPI|nr:hypothetical protein NPIL_485981 [Nephila pilipes]